MTPKQQEVVDLFFQETVPPTCTEPFYCDQEDFEALRAMWEEHKELLRHTGCGPGRRYELLGPMKDKGANP